MTTWLKTSPTTIESREEWRPGWPLYFIMRGNDSGRFGWHVLRRGEPPKWTGPFKSAEQAKRSVDRQ